MKRKVFHLKTVEESSRFGRALGEESQSGDLLCLDGDLGAGKTTLSQSIAKGLQVPDDIYVTSPSFAIFHEYIGGRIPMYHMDFYRLQDSVEVEDMGFDEYFYLSGLTVVEWSMRAEDIMPEKSLFCLIEIAEDDSRKVTCSFNDPSWEGRLSSILTKAGIC